MISRQMILTLNPQHATPAVTALKLQEAASRFGITNPQSIRAWLANMAVESALIPVRENLYYTDAARARSIFPVLNSYPDSAFVRQPQPMANIVYAGRLGNGSVASGEGWLYRGGGLIQTTGRDHYRRTGQLIGVNLEAHPELIEQISVAALAAAAYWTRLSDGNAVACAGDIKGTRRCVNGPAMLGLSDMLAYYSRLQQL